VRVYSAHIGLRESAMWPPEAVGHAPRRSPQLKAPEAARHPGA